MISSSKGGQERQFAWLQDNSGVTWQIVSDVLVELIIATDPEKSGRGVRAMSQMMKIGIETIKQA